MTASFQLPPADPKASGLFAGFLGRLAEVLVYVITLPIRSAITALDNLTLATLEADPRLPEQVKRQLRDTPAFRDRPSLLPFVNIAGSIAGILPLFSAMGASFYNDAIRILYSLYRPSELSAAEAASAVVAGQIPLERGFAYAARAGVPDADFRVMLDTAGATLAPGQLLDLLNRRELTQDDVERFLRESNLKDKFIPLLLKLRFQLLGAPDYIRMAVRDVFTPAKRAELTLDEGFPELLVQRFQAIGYSDSDARDLWAAHWELPSPTQAYDMLHRGLITSAELDAYLESADYAPKWRPLLKAISYSPLTRVDVRRAYKLGVVDLAQVKRTYMDLGYDDANAEILTRFTKEDADTERVQERELLVGPVKAKALAMYQARRITEAQLRATLANLKYPEETVNRFVADIEFVREADRLDDLAAAVKAAYIKGLRPRDATEALLEAGGWAGDALAELMAGWTLLREVTELQPHQAASRDLTKNEVVAAYAERIVAPEVANGQLLALGYDQTEADTLLAMADLKARKAELDAEIENLHLNYLRGAIDPGPASIALDRLGVTATRRANLLLKWERERAKVVPDFTIAQLEAMVKAKAMPEDIAQRYLADQGYNLEQQTYLLTWWSGKRLSADAAAAAKLRARD